MARAKLKEDPRIPREFRKGDRAAVSTVGELIAELQQLPADLRVIAEWGGSVRVLVTNYNDEYLAAQVVEADDDEEDEDDDDLRSHYRGPDEDSDAY